jgi:hypothetical protein
MHKGSDIGRAERMGERKHRRKWASAVDFEARAELELRHAGARSTSEPGLSRNLLIDYWMGHENGEMGTRYAKQLIENIEWRKRWAEKVGLGFKLPGLPPGIGQLLTVQYSLFATILHN